jgi:transposase
MIRIDSIWLATEPIDMRVGMDTALARVVQVFGAARPHHAYLFTNKRSTRIKVLVYDGFGIWLASRRLNKGRFTWTDMVICRSRSIRPATGAGDRSAMGEPDSRSLDFGVVVPRRCKLL